MLEQDDPAVTWITSLNLQRQERLDQLKKQGVSKEDSLKKVENLTQLTSQFRIDKYFSVNVMREDGVIGKLKLKIKCKQALDALFEKMLSEEDINPIDPNEGVWVRFFRNGVGRDTTYSCDVVQDSFVTESGIKGKTVRKAPLSEKDLKRMEEDAYDLTTGYREITYEEIKRLVDSGGDPAVVDSVFGAPQNFSNKTSFASLASDDGDDSDGKELSAEAVMSKLNGKSSKSFLDSIDDIDD